MAETGLCPGSMVPRTAFNYCILLSFFFLFVFLLFLKKVIYFSQRLFYNIVVVFAIHWHGSAMGLHVFLIVFQREIRVFAVKWFMDNLRRQTRKLSTIKQQKQQDVTLTEYLLCSSFCGKSLTYFLSFHLSNSPKELYYEPHFTDETTIRFYIPCP